MISSSFLFWFLIAMITFFGVMVLFVFFGTWWRLFHH